MQLKEKIHKRLAGFGEIMMRLHCPNDKRFQNANAFDIYFGGGEANVCVFLSGLGFETKYITALPENNLAQAAITQLRSHAVDVSAIHSCGNKLGLYFTENGNSLRNSKVIYDRKNSSFAGIAPGMLNWEEALDGVDCFHWSGISPALSQSVAEVCLEALQACKQKGITISADLNYRSTLWDYGKHPSSIMPELLSYADIIIGDINAAAVYFPDAVHNIKIDEQLPVEVQFTICTEALKEKLPAMKVLAMSFRNTDAQHQQTYRGALLLNKEIYFSPVCSIPFIIDRIGSGDAFTGGLLYSLYNDYTPEKIISFAVASGILKHSIAGDFAWLSKKEIEHFIHHGHDSRVIR